MTNNREGSQFEGGGRNIGDAVFVWRRKIRKKEHLCQIISSLTATIGDQVDQIKALTSENKGYLREITDVRSEKIQLLSDITKLEDNLVRLRDKLREVESNAREARVTKTQLQKDDQDNVQQLENKVTRLKAKTNELIAERATMEATVASLKDDLSLKSIQEVRIEAKLQALQKDFNIYADDLKKERETRADLETSLTKTREDLTSMRSRAHELENRLGAENECLKFDVVVLTKTLRKKKDEIDKLKSDKQEMMAYYSKQMENVPKYVKDRVFKFNNTNEFKDETPEKAQLENKVLRLENTLYRKNQLVEGLVRVIRDTNPSFELCHYPELQCCIDVSDYHPTGGLTSTTEPSIELYDPDILGDDPLLTTTSQNFFTTMATISNNTDSSVLYIKNNIKKSE